tara:strand:+ start:411 stop:917 length:507 start_codon:yes stop_codon:yes gene_type:complete
MLIPNCGYGSKDATIHVLNNHLHQYWKAKISINKWVKVYKDHYNISRKHIKKFYEYINQENVNIKNYPTNNTEVMQEICKNNNIEYNVTAKILRCGLSSVASCIANGLKPFMVGYSLDTETTLDHVYKNNRKINSNLHNAVEEIVLIKSLHKAGLVDATLCCLIDDKA